MSNTHPLKFHEPIADFIRQRTNEFETIKTDRRRLLDSLSDYIRAKTERAEPILLTFLCTHNSRRSHLSQIWARLAADFYNIANVQCFSGGTEATAMNERVIASLKRTGFQVTTVNENPANPVYYLDYAEDAVAIECFSKVYDSEPNPVKDFAAIMTCSSADRACPVVPGCELRLPIRYTDPKASDGTPHESETYDERSKQICREMLYTMSNMAC